MSRFISSVLALVLATLTLNTPLIAYADETPYSN